MDFGMQLQDFDKEDRANLGRPYYFDLDMYLTCVEQMIASDEVERAIWMLDNMPGWYRDNRPARAVEIKKQLLKKLYTSVDYLNGNQIKDDIEIDIESIARGKLVFDLCKSLNAQNDAPDIVELAPGTFWLPIGLKNSRVKYNYHSIGLDTGAQDRVIYNQNEDMECRSKIFICFELLEHLHNPVEIYQHYLKSDKQFTHIMLSTPKHTIATANPKWYEADLGHLRTYTPKEFALFATGYWPEFKWTLFDGEVMVLSGERYGS